jgi:hypothetical protein
MSNRHSRQSFLGKDAPWIIENTLVGIAGLGGGGSHIVQQLAHIGFKKYCIFDMDIVEDTNLNRLVGATVEDAVNGINKVDVAERIIYGLQPKAEVFKSKSRWQDVSEKIRQCDLIFGCLDGFSERNQLEAITRRYLIPYIDIGLDVFEAPGEAPRMAGQLILSMPGYACMWCMGFLNNEKLAREAGRYGAAGPNAQVVWGNGVLASNAVGLAVNLITDWTKGLRSPVYLSYDANDLVLKEHPRMEYLDKQLSCPHYPLTAIGDPLFKAV